jgi:hypothetical protein
MTFYFLIKVLTYFCSYKKALAQVNSVTTIIIIMKIEYGPDKNQHNIEQRGLSFDLVTDFGFDTALVWKDDRFHPPGGYR